MYNDLCVTSLKWKSTSRERKWIPVSHCKVDFQDKKNQDLIDHRKVRFFAVRKRAEARSKWCNYAKKSTTKLRASLINGGRLHVCVQIFLAWCLAVSKKVTLAQQSILSLRDRILLGGDLANVYCKRHFGQSNHLLRRHGFLSCLAMGRKFCGLQRS